MTGRQSLDLIKDYQLGGFKRAWRTLNKAIKYKDINFLYEDTFRRRFYDSFLCKWFGHQWKDIEDCGDVHEHCPKCYLWSYPKDYKIIKRKQKIKNILKD